jgi:hypothetical protein
MLAVAKQLNRTLILTGMHKHYTDRGGRYRLPKPGQLAKDSSSVGHASGAVDGDPPLRKCFKEETDYHMEFSEILDRCVFRGGEVGNERVQW